MRVLLVQQSLNPPGGGNAVAAWMVQALAGIHDVTTFTMRRWDAARVDAYYGTSLVSAGIPQLYASRVSQLLDTLPGRLTRFRLALLFRGVRRVSREFDLLVSADNYTAFGRPGLQYLYYPTPLHPEPVRLRALVRAYYRLCDRISGLSWDTARLNRTLAVSAWTADGLWNDHGMAAQVLYPPVVDPGKGLPWSERTDTFLCVGRFHGSKRFELVVSILARARAWIPDLRLHIVGANVDAEYTRRLVAMKRRFSDWITVDQDLTQSQLLALMRRCRYGIHAMEYEHFGMSVAEMARAGCIVFVHNSGGQVEAVGGTPEVLWRTPDEAVSRIRTVVQDPRLQEDLSRRLQSHAARFSTERFVQELRGIVDDYGVAMALKPGSRSNSS